MPKEVFDSINGTDIIDGSGYNGDTALMLSKYFPDSTTYVFEPLSINIDLINKVIAKTNTKNVIAIPQGLSDKSEQVEIKFNTTEIAKLVTLDECCKDKKIGLIKLDTEGFETQIIKGAREIIKTQKPVLALAI